VLLVVRLAQPLPSPQKGLGGNGVSWAGLEELEARVGVGPTMWDVFMMQERENENRARCCNAAVDCAI
jgi:hypothetical protein